MADAAPSENTTPAPAAASAPATASATDTATPPVAATAPTITPESPQPTPAKTDSTPAATAPKVETAPKTDAPASAPKPTFALPDDLKLAPEAVEKFQTFLGSKTPDAKGHITLSAQELVDVYADQARHAATRWHAQLAAQDKTWEAESKSRFTKPQLAAAETGIGFLTSYEPAFRELAQSYRNNPAFVNTMRIVGELLSEDQFLKASAPPAAAQRSRAERMGYVKPKSN